eukprot:jgi/Mesvir1/6550/Mv16810-RA.1
MQLRRDLKAARRNSVLAGHVEEVVSPRAPVGRRVGSKNPRVVAGKSVPRARRHDLSTRVSMWLDDTFAVDVVDEVIPAYLDIHPDVLDAYLRDSGRLKQLHEDVMLEVTEEWDVILAIAMKLRLGISYMTSTSSSGR